MRLLEPTIERLTAPSRAQAQAIARGVVAPIVDRATAPIIETTRDSIRAAAATERRCQDVLRGDSLVAMSSAQWQAALARKYAPFTTKDLVSQWGMNPTVAPIPESMEPDDTWWESLSRAEALGLIFVLMTAWLVMIWPALDPNHPAFPLAVAATSTIVSPILSTYAVDAWKRGS